MLYVGVHVCACAHTHTHDLQCTLRLPHWHTCGFRQSSQASAVRSLSRAKSDSLRSGMLGTLHSGPPKRQLLAAEIHTLAVIINIHSIIRVISVISVMMMMMIIIIIIIIVIIDDCVQVWTACSCLTPGRPSARPSCRPRSSHPAMILSYIIVC